MRRRRCFPTIYWIGIGIGIGIDSLGFSLELEPNMALSTKQIYNSTESLTSYMFYLLNLAPFYVNTGTKGPCCPNYGHPLIKGRKSIRRIYQQVPESNRSQNRPEMVRIGIGIESCLSLESVSVSESSQCWTRYQYRNRNRKSWYRRLLD